MHDAAISTLRFLNEARARHPRALLAYSGGKDSLACAELCARTFDHVETFFMYLVPGLECVEEALAYGERRWGFRIKQYPHWLAAEYLRHGRYCATGGSPTDSSEYGNYAVGGYDPHEWKLHDVYALARAESGCELLVTGAKKSDSIWRRKVLGNWGTNDTTLYLLIEWQKLDVVAFLKTNGIPMPDSSGKNATGIDLSTPSLLWLYDTFPHDFEKLCEVFPFAEAVPWRRKFFGAQAA